MAAKENRHDNLTFEWHATLTQLDRKRLLVYRLDEAGAEASMHFDRGANDRPRELFQFE